jgi:hypothetical protein
MVMIGPNSSLSNVLRLAGLPSATNLKRRIGKGIDRSSVGRTSEKGLKRRERAYLINAETDSNVYWLNLGLLGFRLM